MESKRTGKKVQVHIARQDGECKEPKFLLLKKPAERGGFWQPVTGKVEEGESYENCALREIEEETGIDVLQKLTKLGGFSYVKQGESIYEMVYLAVVSSPEVKISPEHETFQWATYSAARDLIYFESNRHALDCAADHLRIICSSNQPS
jgi:dATP pyrophosphohydrolase